MKFLLLCSIFPPDAKGGAESSAYHSARWLVNEGHQVAVLTTAKTPEDEVYGKSVDEMQIWRIYWPRHYPVHRHDTQPTFQKIVWHLQDHLDPRNRRIVEKVLDNVKPDFVNLHLVAGIGHNTLGALKDRGIPFAYFLHDMGLACLRSSMFRKGRNCRTKCAECAVSSWLKFRHIPEDGSVTFISPSEFNLATIRSHTEISRYKSAVVPNIDLDEAIPRGDLGNSGPLRLLYVGRLHETKGVDFLLQALSTLPKTQEQVTLTIVGGGPLEGTLRSKYEGQRWVDFTGKVSPSEVRSAISRADILCVPSLWRENHPGVIRQALRAGVPALVSDSGGAKEMVEHGQSGIIIPAGNLTMWKETIAKLLENRRQVEELQRGALDSATKFYPKIIGAQLWDVINATTLPGQAARTSKKTSGSSYRD